MQLSSSGCIRLVADSIGIASVADVIVALGIDVTKTAVGLIRLVVGIIGNVGVKIMSERNVIVHLE